MPGIAGIISRGPLKQRTAALQRMVKSMMHEPFYSSGSYADERLGLCVGWVQHPGSFSDCMPLRNRTGDLCLVFSGEHFPDPGTGSPEGNGRAPDARSLVPMLEQQGTAFLKRLNGWFSGIVIDLRTREIVLFNDRYGMQRIYWCESGENFYFASEAKALLAVRPEPRQLDMKSLGELFSFGCVLDNRSLFSGISLLPPGSAWVLKRGVVKQERYFTPGEWESLAPLNNEEFYHTLRERFVSLLPRYISSKNRIAMSLTGGLDTRMILANIEIPPGKMPCYTFGGMYRDCFDVKIARKVANICGQPHRVLDVDRKFISLFPRLAEQTVHISDGNMDVTGAVELYVNRMAREIAPVRLTGNYGSEILRGSRHLKAGRPRPGLFDLSFERHIHRAAATLADTWRGHPVSFAAFKQTPWYHYNRLSVEQSQLTLRSPYLDNGLVRLMFQAPSETVTSSELSFRLVRDGNTALGAIMTDRGLGGNRGYVVSKLAYLYHEFLFKADYAYNYGMPQWLATLDHALLRPLRMEKIFLGRHKFYHFRVWFRDQLSGYVKEVMLDPRSLERPYLNRKGVEKAVTDHTSGRLNYTTEITKLLTAELLQRLLIDKKADSSVEPPPAGAVRGAGDAKAGIADG
jgi:asparagine synthase (glutamine-hydrolysing)